MKLDKEKFNKLKQLDRIEFRQKLAEIKEKYDVSISWIFVFGMMIIGFLLILIGLNFYDLALVDLDGGINEGINEGKEVLDSLVDAGIFAFKIAFAYLIIEIIINFISTIIEIKKRRELEKEYFKIEVKK